MAGLLILTGLILIKKPEFIKNKKMSGINSQQDKETVEIKTATGNVDDAVEAILNDITAENNTLDQENSDVNIFNSEDQETKNFAQATDETDL